MPLQKQIQSYTFTQGIDTKRDQRLTMKPSRLENSMFVTGDLSKRPGRKLLPSAIDTGGNQTSGEALVEFGGELLRINRGTAYGYGPQQTEWVTKLGGNNYCNVATKTLLAVSSGAQPMDHVVVNGVGVLAYSLAGLSGLGLLVYDFASGTFYQNAALWIGGVTPAARLVPIGTKVLIFWGAGHTAIRCAALDTTAPGTAPPSTSVIRNDLDGNSFTFDAIPFDASMAVLCYPSSGINVTMCAVGPNATVLTSPAATTFAAGSDASSNRGGMALQKDTSGNVYLFITDMSLSQTNYFVRSSSFGSVLGSTKIADATSWSPAPGEMGAAASIEVSAGQITVVMSEISQLVYGYLGKAVVGAAGVLTPFAQLPSTPGLVVASDAVAYDGTALFGAVNYDTGGSNYVVNTSGLQASAYVLNLNGQAVARTLTNKSKNVTTGRVARSYSSASVQVAMMFPEQGRQTYASGNTSVISVAPTNAALVTINKTAANTLPMVTVGASLYIGGGYPRIYDGALLGESGFSQFPDMKAVLTDNGAGNLSAGTYQYRFVYSWVGNNGELVRSPVSPGATITLAAGHQTIIHIAPMPLAMRDVIASQNLTTLEVYRTTANGTVFYRADSVFSPTTNVTTGAGLSGGAININDNLSDANLQLGEIMYTTGGILDWEAPPPYAAACAHQGRLVILPSENPYAFMPSSQWVEGEQLRFSSFNIGYVPADTGALTGCASMDGKLLLLTQSAGYVTLGDGPDNLGNNQYPSPQRMAGVDAGPLPGSPVVTTPLGVIYQSVKGLTLIDRSLNQQFIGADPEKFTIGPWVLRSITVHPRLQQIHFQVDDGSDIQGTVFGDLVTSNGGYRLVLDYMNGNQWTVDPACGAQGATLYQGLYTQVRSDGTTWQEAPALFLDNGATYTSLIETPWLKPAGVQGYFRCWYVTLIGTYGSDFTLALDVAYSYATTAPDVPVYNPADSVTFNGSGVFTPGGAFEIRHHLGKKCSSVKFRIRDLSIGGTGLGMGLTDLSLEWGVKKGVFKLPAAQTA